jgi:hypothetical protein
VRDVDVRIGSEAGSYGGGRGHRFHDQLDDG